MSNNRWANASKQLENQVQEHVLVDNCTCSKFF